MKSCPACKKENKDDVQYCEDCGRELPDQPDAVTDAADADPAPVAAAPAGQKSGEVAEDDMAAENALTDEVEVVEEEPEEERGSARTIEPHLVVVSTGDKILLTEPDLVIGREDPISSIFPDIDTTPFGGLEGGVSRKHARLYEKNGTYYIEDLNSTNYTLINKQKIDPATARPLVVGDEIRLGRVALLFML